VPSVLGRPESMVAFAVRGLETLWGRFVEQASNWRRLVKCLQIEPHTMIAEALQNICRKTLGILAVGVVAAEHSSLELL
jgi:hypothetical protein